MAESPVTYRVGDVTITRVPEKLIGDFTPEYLFPEWEPALVQEHREWMASACWDDAREHLASEDAGSHYLNRHWNWQRQEAQASLFRHLNEPYLERLAAVDVTPYAVDYVLLTHLHTDHVDWNTQFLNGRWVPTFLSAKYVFAKVEDEYFSGPGGRDRPNFSLYEDSVLPIIEAGQAVMIEADRDEFIDGPVFNPTPRHSVGHMSISLRSGGEDALFGGDVMHLPVHLTLPWLDGVGDNHAEDRRLLEIREICLHYEHPVRQDDDSYVTEIQVPIAKV